MTLFSFSISTYGLWLCFAGQQIGFQWIHSKAGPYINVRTSLGKLIAGPRGIRIFARELWINPPVYRTVFQRGDAANYV